MRVVTGVIKSSVYSSNMRANQWKIDESDHKNGKEQNKNEIFLPFEFFDVDDLMFFECFISSGD